MGKTLTITDDDLGTAAIRIEDGGLDGPRVTRIEFTEIDGRGLSGAAMGLMEHLGLRLPAEPSATAVPARRRKAKAVPQRTPPAPRRPAARRTPATQEAAPAPELGGAMEAPALPAVSPSSDPRPQFSEPGPPATPPAPWSATQRGGRRRSASGGAPPAEDLRACFIRHEGIAVRMAAEYGVHPTTVGDWLRKARERGERIQLPNTASAGGRP